MATKIYTVKNDAGETAEVDEDKISEAEKDGYLPVVTNGQEEVRASFKDIPKAEADGFKPISRNEVSKTESFVRGAAQEATLGFADEATAALEAVGKSLTGPEKYLDVYRKAREESREAYKQAEEANPLTYLSGQVVGGIAPAVATGGAGLGALGLKQAAKQSAIAGLKYGAGSGLGYSQADLTKGEVGEAALDVAKGGAMGGAFGAAIPLISKPAAAGKNALFEKIDDISPEILDISVEAAKITTRGDEIASKAAKAKSFEKIGQLTEDLNDKILEMAKPKYNDDIKKALETNPGEISDFINTNINRLDDAIEGVGIESDHGKKLNSLKTTLEKFRNRTLEKQGIDPKLQPRSQVEAKLTEEMNDILRSERVNPSALKAVENIYSRVSKLKNPEQWKPTQAELNEFAYDSGIGNLDDAKTILNQLVTIGLKDEKGKEKVFQAVNKLKQPQILDEEGRLALSTGPGKTGKWTQYRPDTEALPVEASAQEILNLRKAMRDVSMGETGLVKSEATKLDQALTEKLTSLMPEAQQKQFKGAMSGLSDIYDLQELLGADFVKGIKAGDTEQREKLVDFITRRLSGLDDTQERETIKQIESKLTNVLGTEGKQWLDEARKQARMNALQNIAYKTGQIRTFGTIEAVGTRIGATIGWTKNNLHHFHTLNTLLPPSNLLY